MAEQVSHDAVNQSELASASALADVAANPTETNPAVNGTEPVTKSNSNAIAPTGQQEIDEVAMGAAEPSAGEAVPLTAEEAPSTEEKGGRVQGQYVNGAQDAGNQIAGPAEDGSVTDTLADQNTTSDTEGSRADGAEQKLASDHHVRTGSVKKPTTFSKVSVTKNFLAKTASPVPAAPKAGDRPSPLSVAPQPAVVARPRLVAKTGALKATQKLRAGPENASGPDGSKVWNKNQPVAPPPPRHFTDEELKQQYGIHLATRLQTDEDGKESKWADIDEDEEDWAPEAVVWMDGTKSTITTSEATATPVPAEVETVIVADPPPKPVEAPKPTLIVKKPAEMGPPKTILKPGIAAQQAKLQNGVSATNSSSDKPYHQSKSPAPAPSKSPWAALPPIDAVPLIHPPAQHLVQHALMPTQDARAYESQTSPQPAREIAADTFERSWREGEGAPRELFNSANGRYEPAPEGRRTSVKPQDAHFRKPSVLQRSSVNGQSPAEPSAAFQTRSSSQVEGTWGHRRGSSVSQGSLPPGRRMSVSRAPELATQPERERRPSTVSRHDVHASPAPVRNEPVKPDFSQQSAWEQALPPRPEASNEAGTEDPIKAQERIMREKREEAKKRRKEEEERLETEKQERLKARLAALEGAGKSRKEREAEAAAVAAQPPPVVEKPKQVATPAAEPLMPAEASAEAAPALEDQSLPSAPEPAMVPQMAPAETQLPSPVLAEPQPPEDVSEPLISSADGPQRHEPRTHLSPRATARTPFGQQASPYRAPASSYSSPGDRKQQPFVRSPLTNNDAFSSIWNATPSNGNVWGTSSGIGNGTFDKASSFAPMPMSQQNLPPPPGMGRPSTSTRISPQSFGHEVRSPSMQQQQLAEQTRPFPPPGIDSRPDVTWGHSRPSGASPGPGLGRQTHLPGPIGPPSRAQQQQPQQPVQPVQRADPLSSWQTAAAKLPHQYSATANVVADTADRQPQQDAPSMRVPGEDSIKEVFKQTSARQSKLGGPRRYEKTMYTIHDAQGSRAVSTLSPAPPSTQTQPSVPVPTASPLNNPQAQAAESMVRIPDGSLNPAHGGLSLQQPPIGPSSAPQAPVTPRQDQVKVPAVSQPDKLPSAQPAPQTTHQALVKYPAVPLPDVPLTAQDGSPPPPETSSHPVFNNGDGDGHPHVKLPPPPPRVRLPPGPARTSQTQPPVQQPTPAMLPPRPGQGWAPPGVARPIVMTEDWQARFNGLFNRTTVQLQTEVPPSPPKTPPKVQDPAPAVAASSRVAMDEVPAARAATVSLPQSPPGKKATSPEGFSLDESPDVVSKPTIDGMFTEELSFGSKPNIRVPRPLHYRHHAVVGDATAPAYNLLKMSPNFKALKAVDTQTREDATAKANLLFFFHRHQQGYFVNLPGTPLTNKLVKIAAAGAPRNKAPGSRLDRKVSGMSAPRKGKAGEASSPVAGGPSGTGSRSASLQASASPAPAPAAGAANGGGGAAGPAEAWSAAAEGSGRKPGRPAGKAAKGRGHVVKAA